MSDADTTAALFSPGMRRAAVLFAARSFNPVVSLIFSLIAGRLLTVEDHGIYGWAMARAFVVQAFAEVGLQQSLIRFLAPAIRSGNIEDSAAILRASLQLKFYASGLASVLTALYMVALAGAAQLTRLGVPAEFLPAFHPDELHIAWMILLGGVGMSILTYLDSVLVSNESFIRLSLWLPSVGFIRLLLLGLFLVASGGGLRAEQALYAFALGPFLAAAVFFFFYPAADFLRPSRPEIWKPWVGRLFRYNLWIMAAAFLAIVSDWMEVLIIDKSGDSGLFNAARMPMQGFLILLSTMSSILLPRFLRLAAPQEFRDFFRRLYQFLIPAFVLFLPGFWILPWFILRWFGAEYVLSVQVFYLLYPNFILRIYFAPLGVALFALDQPRLIAIEAGLRMTAGLLFNLALYPEFGILGAAWASLLAQCAGWAFLLYCYFTFFRRGEFPFNRSVRPPQ